MQSIRWLAVLAAALIITACFFTWVNVDKTDYFIGGFYSGRKNQFGQPGILHVIFCGTCILFFMINKVWSLRSAFFISAFNVAWAARNFFLISACSEGVCPEKHTALYVILIASFALTVLAAFIQPKQSFLAS